MAGEAEIDRKNKQKQSYWLPARKSASPIVPACPKNAVKFIQKENMRLEKLGEGVPSLKRRGRWSAISATLPTVCLNF